MNSATTLVILAFVAAACTPQPAPILDPRVEVVPDTGLVLVAPAVVSLANGFTRVSVPLRNTAGHDTVAQCVVDWYDAERRPVAGLTTPPMRIAAAPFSATSCEFVAPRPTITSFTVQVVPSY